MQVQTSQDSDLHIVENVEKPVGKTSQDRTAHVAIYALIERRIESNVPFDAEEFGDDSAPNPGRCSSYSANAIPISVSAAAL